MDLDNLFDLIFVIYYDYYILNLICYSKNINVPCI